MKKIGFTLQEVLISMAIVGIVAALTVPAVMNMMPDETKTKYMKAYSALTSITNDLLSDNTIYWTEYDNAGVQRCIGMACTSNFNNGDDFNALRQAHPDFENTLIERVLVNDRKNDDIDSWRTNWTTDSNIADAKYAILVASRLNLQSDITYTSPEDGQSRCTFSTTDGTQWTITSTRTPVVAAGQPDDFDTTVTVDVDPNNVTSFTIAETDNDNNVDTFTFDVSREGSVRATDALGQVFLRTPTDMHRKAEDRAAARE